MVLVIGGAGYIGSHMVRLLRERGVEHVVFDNFEYGHRDAVRGSRVFEGDLRRPGDLRAALDQHPDVDVVMHFAAYTYVGESVEQPARYWDNNVAAVLGLLDEMRRRNISQFVFSSTCATFGVPEYLPLDEEHPQRPISPYGETKLAVERILRDYSRAYGLRSVGLRYFNAAGAAPDGSIGEDHRPEAHLIPLAIFAALGKTPPLKVFGDDYDTPDGTCVRDYIHVNDLAEAHLKAVEHLRVGGESRFYNLGNGRGFTVREVLRAVEAATGQPVPHEIAPRRPGDPPSLVGDSRRIRDDWDWNPRYPDLDAIVRHAWAWHRLHPDGYTA